ncbi:hypothetical protein KL919_001199 [Ogataea angusta]|nr:hypothetical protein KL919_001199 [Ogataea angusta]
MASMVRGWAGWPPRAATDLSISVALCGHGAGYPVQRCPELGNKHEEVEDHARHRSPDADRAREGELVGAPASHGERFSEPHVAQANRPPREDGRETRQSHEPGKNVGFFRRRSKEAEQADREGQTDGNERSSLSVDVAKDLWRKALFCERGKRSAAGVDTGVSDRKHGNEDNDVHDAREHLDAVVLDGNDERRGGGVGGRAKQPVVVVGDQEADHCERAHVEKRDSPEHLFGGSRQGFSWVGGLCGGEACQLGAAETERTGDKHGTQALEAVVERSRIVPVASTNHLVFGASAGNKHDRQNNKAHDGDDLDEGEHELGLAVALDSEKVDEHDSNVENSHPGRRTNGVVPELDGDGGGDELDRHHHDPLHGVVPGHRKAPRGRNKSGVVLQKRARDRERDSQLAHGVDGAENEDADNEVCDEKRGGAARRERGARTNKQPRSDGASNADHLDMTGLERPLQRRRSGHDVGALDLREIGVDLGDGKRLERVDEPVPSAGHREGLLDGAGGRVRVRGRLGRRKVAFLCVFEHERSGRKSMTLSFFVLTSPDRVTSMPRAAGER